MSESWKEFDERRAHNRRIRLAEGKMTLTEYLRQREREVLGQVIAANRAAALSRGIDA